LLLILGTVAIKSSLYLVPVSPFLLIENNIFFPLSQAIGLMFFLIPLSLSMTLLWKIKDAFLADNSEQQEEQESLLTRSDTL
jgi:hypothetical protein